VSPPPVYEENFPRGKELGKTNLLNYSTSGLTAVELNCLGPLVRPRVTLRRDERHMAG